MFIGFMFVYYGLLITVTILSKMDFILAAAVDNDPATTLEQLNFNQTDSNFTDYINNYNKTNAEFADLPLHVLVVGTVLYSFLFVIGVTGNAMVIIVLFKNKELRNCTNYFLANLSIADLMVLFVCVPSGLHDLYAKDVWYLGEFLCKLIPFVENCMGIASIFTILFISCERFFAICQPFKVQTIVTKSRTLKFIALIWIVSITINIPFIYLSQYEAQAPFKDGSVNPMCRLVIKSNGIIDAYIICDTFLIYLVIGIVLLVIYINICMSLTRSTLLFVDHTTNNCNNSQSNATIISTAAATAATTTTTTNNGCKRKHQSHQLCSQTQSPIAAIKNNHYPRSMSDGQKHNLMVRSNTLGTAKLAKELLNECDLVDNSLCEIVHKKKATIYSLKHHQRKPESLSHYPSSSITSIRSSNVLNISKNPFNYLKPRRQLILMLICVIVVFYVCIFPSKISFLLNFELSTKMSMTAFYYLSIIMHALFYANSSINPILYNWLSTKFRRCFMKALGCNQSLHTNTASTNCSALIINPNNASNNNMDGNDGRLLSNGRVSTTTTTTQQNRHVVMFKAKRVPSPPQIKYDPEYTIETNRFLTVDR